jgi:hypothetical protein
VRETYRRQRADEDGTPPRVGELGFATSTARGMLEQAQRMMSDLLDEAGHGELRPGDLRRTAGASERRDLRG